MRPPYLLLLSSSLLASSACTSEPSGPARVFDPCAATGVLAPAASAEQAASVEDALGLWSAAGVDGLMTVAPVGDAAITIEFRSAAASIYGFYDDETATVYVNRGLMDADQRAITIAHELGHALGLPHVDRAERVSLMNPGNLTVAPGEGDRAALAAIWGACDPAADR